VERLAVAEGDSIDLERVLLIADGDEIKVGAPIVEGARVVATSQGEGKGKKIVVFKYKPKVRYRKKTGHRQMYTRLLIDQIIGQEATPAPAKKKATRRKKEVKEDGT